MATTTKISISIKKYACRECGHVTRQSTNHYGQTYSWGRVNCCPKCPPFKRPTVWICQENPPIIPQKKEKNEKNSQKNS